MNLKGKILLVEDNPITAMSLRLFLSDINFVITNEIAYGEHVVEAWLQSPSDIVIMDIVLRGNENGFDAARKIRDSSEVPILFLSASHDRSTSENAMAITNSDLLLKPYEYEDLETKIHNLLQGHYH